MVLAVPQVRRYVLSFVLEEPTRPDVPTQAMAVDAVAELWYYDMAALKAAAQTPQMQAVLANGALDLGAIKTFITEEIASFLEVRDGRRGPQAVRPAVALGRPALSLAQCRRAEAWGRSPAGRARRRRRRGRRSTRAKPHSRRSCRAARPDSSGPDAWAVTCTVSADAADGAEALAAEVVGPGDAAARSGCRRCPRRRQHAAR